MKFGCFTGDTLVLTKDGHKRIHEIKEGDFVLAKNIILVNLLLKK
ncbi:MAG: hypothetical protein ABF289_07265 [Clostridiales bacterium]